MVVYVFVCVCACSCVCVGGEPEIFRERGYTKLLDYGQFFFFFLLHSTFQIFWNVHIKCIKELNAYLPVHFNNNSSNRTLTNVKKIHPFQKADH